MSTIYLVPNLLGESALEYSLPQGTIDIVRRLKFFFVEDAKSARRFLKVCGVVAPYDHITFFLCDKHTTSSEAVKMLQECRGEEAGIVSEAGVPGVADPGGIVVSLAHSNGFRVCPLIGPSSILLALMASGFNGQQFTFNGYIPIERPQRIAELKKMEETAYNTGYTQIFIETPYRNNHVLEDICANMEEKTMLCVACEITLPGEQIISGTIAHWQTRKIDLKSRPAVFILSGPQKSGKTLKTKHSEKE